tara:strand:+ start:344 stop:583 length:240 start_codon:yes stop_codon:yes gene_type:complete
MVAGKMGATLVYTTTTPVDMFQLEYLRPSNTYYHHQPQIHTDLKFQFLDFHVENKIRYYYAVRLPRLAFHRAGQTPMPF